MLKLGSHVGMNAPDYVLGSVHEAFSYNANCLMLYTGAPQNSFRTPINKLKIEEAAKAWTDAGFAMEDIIIHLPYIINLANTFKPDIIDMGKQALKREIERTNAIGARYMVLHPGSSLKGDLDESLALVASSLDEIIQDCDRCGIICLETMAGKGSEVGRTFQEIRRIIDLSENSDHLGVCLDTCHVHDAGYNLTDFDYVLDEFDRVIGLDRLKCLHINDSKNPCGAQKDRHANIGEGFIGLETLRKIVHNPRVDNIPMILETPYVSGKAPYKEEIALLRQGD